MIIPLLRLGAPKGLKGLQKVHHCLVGGDPQAYDVAAQWYLRSATDTLWSPTGVEHLCAKYIKLAHINHVEAAQEYTHYMLGLERQDLPCLAPDQYYHCELIGKEIINQDQVLLGIVLEVRSSPAHDILVFTQQGKLHFLPLVEAHVLAVAEAIQVYWDTDEAWYS